ncbi:MAG: GNAT family N-acetyltransferase [Cyanothece sp. SIO1E1]|nr:GNAT family N-acetyltransferase [Cyanothece sp. SIO1E1]
MHTLNRLTDPFSALQYGQFTFPAYRSRLATCQSNGSTVAISACIDREPVGLTLAELQADSTAEILSIFVKSSYRNQGIGSALLNRLQTELQLQGCHQLELVYTTGPSTPILERILQKFDWSTPEPRRLICKFDSRRLLQLPGVQKPHRLPKGFSLFSWTDLTEQERRSLSSAEVTAWAPEDLHPFRYEHNFDPATSLGLRHQGAIIGWMINHRLGADTIRFSSSYVRPDLQRRGRIFPLYAEAIKRVALQPEISTILWTVPYIYPTMASICKRHIDYAKSIAESRGSSKVLTAAPITC